VKVSKYLNKEWLKWIDFVGCESYAGKLFLFFSCACVAKEAGPPASESMLIVKQMFVSYSLLRSWKQAHVWIGIRAVI